jgi:hypothetical protein
MDKAHECFADVRKKFFTGVFEYIMNIYDYLLVANVHGFLLEHADVRDAKGVEQGDAGDQWRTQKLNRAWAKKVFLFILV